MKRQLLPSSRDYAEVLVALGANATASGISLESALLSALTALDRADFTLQRRSALFVTPAVPAGAGPDFVNAAASFRTRLSPEAVLARLHAVEAEQGRVRKERWGARVLDLDLLAWDDAVLPDAAGFRTWAELPFERQKTETPDRLILPHPRMQDRGFVLIPLAEVAPDWRHPVLGRTVAEMAAALPAAAREGITRLD